MTCPCGTTKDFSECCEPIIEGKSLASTAEALMRARYSAYSEKLMDFVETSHDPKTKKKSDMDANREWAKQTQWLGLEILSTTAGQPEDSTGVVEFKASYLDKGEEKLHHEVSEFIKRGGKWYFSKGKKPHLRVERSAEEKIGRNDPCHCGSGKKYKKCCAS